MTDNQFNQLFDLVTKSVTGVQRLEKGQARLEKDVAELKTDVIEIKTDIVEIKGDIAELKTDVAELKEGQTKIDTQMQIANKSLMTIHGESLNYRIRIEMLEQKTGISN